MQSPCATCQYKSLPKQGMYLGSCGRTKMGAYKHRPKRKLKPNPCWVCIENGMPGQYADSIENTNPMPPTRAGEVYTVGSNVMDKSLEIINEGA